MHSPMTSSWWLTLKQCFLQCKVIIYFYSSAKVCLSANVQSDFNAKKIDEFVRIKQTGGLSNFLIAKNKLIINSNQSVSLFLILRSLFLDFFEVCSTHIRFGSIDVTKVLFESRIKTLGRSSRLKWDVSP